MDDADNNTEDGGVDQRSDSQEHHDINIDITDLPDPSEPWAKSIASSFSSINSPPT